MKKLSETTIKMHEGNFARLKKELEDPFDINEVLDFFESISLQMSLFYLRAILYEMDSISTTSYKDSFLKMYQERQIEVRKVPKIVKLDATYKDLIKVRDYHKTMYDRKSDTSYLQKWIVASFYLELPIRNDLPFLKFRDYDKEKDNYFDGEKFILNQYKTAKVYGPKIFILPPYLISAIRTHLSDRQSRNKVDWHRDSPYVFIRTHKDRKGSSDTGGLYDKNTFLTYLKQIYKELLGFPLSFTQIRKIKINHEHEKVETIDEMIEIADKYMHRVDTELIYYVEH